MIAPWTQPDKTPYVFTRQRSASCQKENVQTVKGNESLFLVAHPTNPYSLTCYIMSLCVPLSLLIVFHTFSVDCCSPTLCLVRVVVFSSPSLYLPPSGLHSIVFHLEHSLPFLFSSLLLISCLFPSWIACLRYGHPTHESKSKLDGICCSSLGCCFGLWD